MPDVSTIVYGAIAFLGAIGVGSWSVSCWRLAHSSSSLDWFEGVATELKKLLSADTAADDRSGRQKNSLSETQRRALIRRMAERWDSHWDAEKENPVDRLCTLLKKQEFLTPIQERLALITSMVKETNVFRTMPMLDDLKEISRERELRHMSLMLLTLSASTVLLAGICGTLCSIDHGHLADILKLKEVLNPSKWAIGVCVVLYFLKVGYEYALEKMFTRMDEVTMTLFLPLFRPSTSLERDLRFMREKIMPLFGEAEETKCGSRKAEDEPWTVGRLLEMLQGVFQSLNSCMESCGNLLQCMLENPVVKKLPSTFACMRVLQDYSKLQVDAGLRIWHLFALNAALLRTGQTVACEHVSRMLQCYENMVQGPMKLVMDAMPGGKSCEGLVEDMEKLSQVQSVSESLLASHCDFESLVRQVLAVQSCMLSDMGQSSTHLKSITQSATCVAQACATVQRSMSQVVLPHFEEMLHYCRDSLVYTRGNLAYLCDDSEYKQGLWAGGLLRPLEEASNEIRKQIPKLRARIRKLKRRVLPIEETPEPPETMPVPRGESEEGANAILPEETAADSPEPLTEDLPTQPEPGEAEVSLKRRLAAMALDACMLSLSAWVAFMCPPNDLPPAFPEAEFLLQPLELRPEPVNPFETNIP